MATSGIPILGSIEARGNPLALNKIKALREHPALDEIITKDQENAINRIIVQNLTDAQTTTGGKTAIGGIHRVHRPLLAIGEDGPEMIHGIEMISGPETISGIGDFVARGNSLAWRIQPKVQLFPAQQQFSQRHHHSPCLYSFAALPLRGV